MRIIKIFAPLLLLLLPNTLALSASASTCRYDHGHDICILSIKRSAKKYWEYKAVISVDGVKSPRLIYNCRGSFKIQPDGKVLQFAEHDPGKLICSFFPKP